MKKIFLALVLVLCMAGVAAADTVTDTTLFNATGTVQTGDFVSKGWGDVNLLNGTGDWVTWEHQFVYNPHSTASNVATLTVYLRDDNGEGDGGFLGYKNEYAIGWTEDGTWAFGEIDTASYNYDINFSALADGSFYVTLASIYGDFYIDKSELTMSVPEPMTILLLGLGLVGIAGIRRKFKS